MADVVGMEEACRAVVRATKKSILSRMAAVPHAEGETASADAKGETPDGEPTLWVDKPSAPGFYWFDEGGAAQAVEVWKDGDGTLRMQIGGLQENLYVDKVKGRWQEIEPPKW